MAGLEHKQEEAIAALLTCPTILAAAAQVGVSERTLFRWLSDDAGFQASYREAKRSVVQHAMTRLQQAATAAVDTLEAIMGDADKPSGSRVTAARSVLDLALKTVELEELAERVAVLERMVHEWEGRQ
jgi:hypothetical protein